MESVLFTDVWCFSTQIGWFFLLLEVKPSTLCGFGVIEGGYIHPKRDSITTRRTIRDG